MTGAKHGHCASNAQWAGWRGVVERRLQGAAAVNLVDHEVRSHPQRHALARTIESPIVADSQTCLPSPASFLGGPFPCQRVKWIRAPLAVSTPCGANSLYLASRAPSLDVA